MPTTPPTTNCQNRTIGLRISIYTLEEGDSYLQNPSLGSHTFTLAPKTRKNESQGKGAEPKKKRNTPSPLPAVDRGS